MKMLFFSDLDNTLIYSYRHILPKEKRVVEYKDGQELSRMTDKTFEFLKQLQECKDIMFVPLTTRTVEQYKRIHVFQHDLVCKYALVCNGAILLEDGKKNSEWEKESIEMAGNQLEEMERIYDKMGTLVHQSHLHIADSYFAYCISDNPEECCNILREAADNNKVDIFYHSRKVYCIPKVFSKGMAVKRFCKKIPAELAVGAGDSILDVSMLSACNIAFGSSDIAGSISECEIIPENGEFVFNDIAGLIN